MLIDSFIEKENQKLKFWSKNNIFYVFMVFVIFSGIGYQVIVKNFGIPFQILVIIPFFVFVFVHFKSKSNIDIKISILLRKQLLSYLIWASLYFISMQFFYNSAMTSFYGITLSRIAVFTFTLSIIIITTIMYISFSISTAFEKMVKYFVIIFIFNAILDIRALIINPRILRSLAGALGDTISINSNTIGVSGYPNVYTVAIIFPLIIGSISLLKGRNKLFLISISALFLVYVFMSALATAMLIMLLSIVLVYFFKLSKVKKVFILPFIVVLSISIFNTDFVTGVLINVADSIDIVQYKEKLYDIADSINSDEATGSVGARVDRYEKSIQSFSASPIIGVGFDKNSVYSIGGHATIIDTFGLCGVIGGIPLLLFIFYSYRISKRKWKDTKYSAMIDASFINFLIIATTKSIMSSYVVFVSIVLLVPIIPHYIEKIRCLEVK